MVFNATFNNISSISWRSVYWWRKPEDTVKSNRPVTSHLLYHLMLHTSPWSRFELTTSVVIGTYYIGSCKSNYQTITATTAPSLLNKFSFHNMMKSFIFYLYNWWLSMRLIQGLINPWNMIFTEASPKLKVINCFIIWH